MKLYSAVILAFVIIVFDQYSKIFVKSNFFYGEEIKVLGLDSFRIHFIENEGMAWGTQIPGQYGKMLLTFFRILVVFGVFYWLYDSVKKERSNYLIVAITLVLAGALGNIIDSVFYGVIFDQSTATHLATLGAENNYGTWFHGKVVDMFYLPIYEFKNVPSWFPFANSDGSFTFFNAIFNIADIAISTGVGILIVFNKKAFAQDTNEIVFNELED